MIIQDAVNRRFDRTFFWPYEFLQRLERADDINTLPNLRNSKIVRGEAFSRNVISQAPWSRPQDFLNRFPGSAFVMLQQIGDIFKDEKARSFLFKNSRNIEKKISLLRALEAKLITRL